MAAILEHDVVNVTRKYLKENAFRRSICLISFVVMG